jgi:hypothetical protein
MERMFERGAEVHEGGCPVPAEASNAPAVESPGARPLKSNQPGVRTYEELDGAQGRAVFFRPHRFAAADLAPLRCTVAVSIGGALHDCALRDVSQSGVAFSWPADLPVQQGQLIRVALRFDSHEAWRGSARIGSVREQDGGQVVGASFDGMLLDTDEILHLRDVRRWKEDGAALRMNEKPWHTSGRHAFKAAIADFRLFLEDAEEKLRDYEAALPWHVLQDRASAPCKALVSRLRTEIAADLIRFAADIDEARRGVSPEEESALREFSLRQLDRFIMQVPWMHRARHKPFGYPGDYEVMNSLYERDFEGATLFARAVCLAFQQTPPVLGVRYRKDLMVRQLKAALDRHTGSSRPVRFLSIAAGPARELQELLSQVGELPAPLEIVLFEQDRGALAHAYRRLQPLAEARFPGRVRMTFLNESIKRLLRDPHLFDTFGKFDAVYSCGLFDYLQDTTAVRLARNLCAAAAPEGQVLIANMVDHPGRWFMEHHLDWELIYRTREQLADIGRRAAPGARIRVLEEEAGVNPFIELVQG